MRILVFGAGGYIGIPLCEELARRGHYVLAADRGFFGKFPEYQKDKLDLLVADIRTFTMGKRINILSPKMDYDTYDCVIDLAGLSNDATAEIDPWLTTSINLNGGKRLATLAKEAGVKRYVYSSSCAVYGHGDEENLTEPAPLKPLTAYAESKAKVEEHIRSLETPGFVPVILRMGTLFGVAPRMRFDLAVNVMTMRAWKDGLIYIMGGGEQRRPFVHVSDVVNAFVNAVEMPVAGTFNVATENMTIAAVAKEVSDNFVGLKIHNIPDDPDKRSYSVSAALARDKLAWRPRLRVVDGIVEVKEALRSGKISADDPTCYTLQWYRSLIEWDRRIADLKLDGVLL